MSLDNVFFLCLTWNGPFFCVSLLKKKTQIFGTLADADVKMGLPAARPVPGVSSPIPSPKRRDGASSGRGSMEFDLHSSDIVSQSAPARTQSMVSSEANPLSSQSGFEGPLSDSHGLLPGVLSESFDAADSATGESGSIVEEREFNGEEGAGRLISPSALKDSPSFDLPSNKSSDSLTGAESILSVEPPRGEQYGTLGPSSSSTSLDESDASVFSAPSTQSGAIFPMYFKVDFPDVVEKALKSLPSFGYGRSLRIDEIRIPRDMLQALPFSTSRHVSIDQVMFLHRVT